MSNSINLVSKDISIDIDYFNQLLTNLTDWEYFSYEIPDDRTLSISKILCFKSQQKFDCQESNCFIEIDETNRSFLEEMNELTFGKNARYFHVDYGYYKVLHLFIQQFANNKDFWIEIDTESNIPAVDYIKKLESKPNWDWRLTDDLYIDSDELEKIIAAGKKTIDNIINGLDEKVRTLPNIKTRVIEILGRLGKFKILGDDVIDILLMAFKNESVDARESACYALADNLSFRKVIPVF